MCIGYANAQVGINTTSPKASLHIERHTGLLPASPQGVLLPHLSKDQRDLFDKDRLTTGLMIFNTEKNCIDWWNGNRWICTDGTQADIPLPVSRLNDLPDIELENSAHWISSIFDKDYLSITSGTYALAAPTGKASLNPQQADGIATGGDDEPLLDVQGTVPTENNAIKRFIPIKAANTGVKLSEIISGLSAFKTYAYISDEYTKDGQGGTVILEWEKPRAESQAEASTEGYIEVKIYAQDKEIQLKQLDLVAGQGKDQMGIKITTFKYPKNKKEAEQSQGNWTGKYDLYLISGITDKNFVKSTVIGQETKKYRHQFIYVPVMAIDGKIWLNNNLGAGYANIHKKGIFNPGQQAKTPTDYFAYGSLFQWGREADGHELMTWGDASSKDENNINYPTYRDVAKYNWQYDRWAELKTFLDNCPEGWKTPDKSILETLDAKMKTYHQTPDTGFLAGGLRIPLSGFRSYTNGKFLHATGEFSWMWSSTEREDNEQHSYFLDSHTPKAKMNKDAKSYANALRCVKK